MIGLKVLCCILSTFTTYACAARILGVVPTPSYSHQVVYQPIWKELSLRGHQVTTITTYPINDSRLVNLTEIDFTHSLRSFDNNNYVQEFINSNCFETIPLTLNTYQEVAHIYLSNHEVQNLIKNEKFDLVMVEFGLLSTLAFAKTSNAPIIVMSSIDAPSDLHVLMGNPTHPIVYPDPFVPFEDNLSLSDRLLLVVFRVFCNLFKIFVVIPSQQLLVDQYFGPHYPPVQELQNEISLLLVNSDPIFHKVKSLVPTIVQFGGGSHRTIPKPLPKDLKTVLDAAENGFIYFSLGSNANSNHLSKETHNVIMEAFAELPCKVLWKFEADDLPNKPKNVITSKWFPQQDVFKHPKIRLFITQGGLQSIDEAIYDNVPMIGIPFMWDQHFNVNKMVHRGLGLSLNHKTLRKDEFKDTILEVINNPKYRNKIKKLAEQALDQPMTGLEKAVWWTEYVIRHNGTKHLRSPLLDIPFYQYYFLDVAAVFLLVLVVLLITTVFAFKSLCKLLGTLTISKKTN